MNYEEKYKNALSQAKQAINNIPDKSLAEWLQNIFPELKESEDEKIRKRIIALVNAHGQGMYKNEMLAWLEKQGEQKPAWSEEDEPQKELAEIYLAVFDEKFPILPTLKGKQLADYKNFLNKCQQILGLKYWSLRPLQAKLFEKLSLLWATWGAEHLQIGQAHGEFDTPKVKETMILE